jgi:hypothetical protein
MESYPSLRFINTGSKKIVAIRQEMGKTGKVVFWGAYGLYREN